MNVIILDTKTSPKETTNLLSDGKINYILQVCHHFKTEINSIPLKKILKEEFFLISIDQFSPQEFNPEKIQILIEQAKLYNADLIYIDAESFTQVLPVTDNLFWVDSCLTSRFIIIFRKYYKEAFQYIKSLSSLEYLNFPSEFKFLAHPFSTSKTRSLLYPAAEEKLTILKKLNSYYLKNENLCLEKDELNQITIPTYIINLEHRNDRLKNILEEFKNKPEFDIHVQKGCFHENGAKGLWYSICQIIKKAKINNDDIIIIIEDDHIFTKDYNRYFFIKNVIEAGYQGVEILSGGVSGGIRHAIPVTENRYWVDHFWGTQFIVIYKKIYTKILEIEFNETDTADDLLSAMSVHKMVLFPFISVQKDFGYSDITKIDSERGDLSKIFIKAQEFLNIYHKANQRFKNCRLDK